MLVVDQLKKNDPQLRVVAWVVVSGLFVLLAGLWYVQVVSSGRYQENQKNQSFRTVRLPALRGKILDRNGAELAENQPSYNLSLYLEDHALRAQIQKQFQTTKAGRKLTRAASSELGRATRYLVVSNAVQELSRLLQQPITLEEARFQTHYEQSLALPLPVVKGLNALQIARFQENSSNPPGLDLEIQPLRVYPRGAAAAHVIGYLKRNEDSAEEEDAFFNYRLPDYTGISGIEAMFNEQLRGRAGAKSVLVNNLGYRQSENVWTPVEAGQNVFLTIDLAVQKAADQALAEVRTRHARTLGAAVVLDVRNGDVLALASSPTFDPNQYIRGLTHPEWAVLSDPEQRPLLNRAVYGGFPPGSIFKMVVGLAALEAGFNPTNVFRSPGYAMVGNRHIADTAPAGDYDFRRAFKLSSNTYFIDCGLGTGVDKILAMGQRLHFGERTGVPLRQDSPAILPTREWQRENMTAWRDGDTANLCIGQGEVLVTPLQVAVMTAAVANGGKVLWPRLVEKVQAQELVETAVVKAASPAQVRDELPVSARTLEIMRAAMLADVEDNDGTGRSAAVPGFRVCGKTGTAQLMKGRVVVDHVTWFASFAPYENPRYAVVVMVESGSSGGGTCAPAARKIYEALQKREKVIAMKTPALAGLN